MTVITSATGQVQGATPELRGRDWSIASGNETSASYESPSDGEEEMSGSVDQVLDESAEWSIRLHGCPGNEHKGPVAYRE